jgi:hypothetical protein
MSTVSRPRCASDDLADTLSALTGGMVRVEFCPDAFTDDPESRGHQWYVELSVDAGYDLGISESWVDDRNGDVRTQVVELVRNWVRSLQDLADKIEGSASAVRL